MEPNFASEMIGVFINTLLQMFFKLWYLWLIVLVIVFIQIFFNRILPKIIRKHRIKSSRKAGNEWFSDKDFLQELKRMNPSDFEEYTAELFRKLGYKAKAVGHSHDGGIDVIAEKDGIPHYIQCKRYNHKVPVKEIRDFYGVIAGKIAKGTGYFVTTDSFTLEAEKFAEDKPIELIDGYKLVEYDKMANS
jgi:restriction system protein